MYINISVDICNKLQDLGLYELHLIRRAVIINTRPEDYKQKIVIVSSVSMINNFMHSDFKEGKLSHDFILNLILNQCNFIMGGN